MGKNNNLVAKIIICVVIALVLLYVGRGLIGTYLYEKEKEKMLQDHQQKVEQNQQWFEQQKLQNEQEFEESRQESLQQYEENVQQMQQQHLEILALHQISYVYLSLEG